MFSWLQRGDDITIWIPLPVNTSKSDIEVTAAHLSLQVSVQGKVVLEGTLHQRIDPDVTCWTYEAGK